MQVFLTAEGVRRLYDVRVIQTGSPLANAIVADIGAETVDVAVILGLCALPAGWQLYR